MRVLVLGGAGFIGSSIVAALAGAGHQVSCVVRDAAAFRRRWAHGKVVAMDLTRPEAARSDTWVALLRGMDAVVNAAGVLHPTVAATAWAVHLSAPEALYRACERAGVRRVVLVSAVGIDGSDTLYARSKRAGEMALASRDLNWTVIRPVVVIGEGSYGGTSLLRALAAFPFSVPVIARCGEPIGIIHKDDLAEGIATLVCSDNAVRETIEACAEERYSLKELLLSYRRWLGIAGTRCFRVPMAVARLIALLGNAANALPITTTTLGQVQTPLGGDPSQFIAATGMRVRNFDEILAGRPASTQDLWHARLFLLKPVLRVLLSAFWAVSALTVLFAPDAFANIAESLPLGTMAARGFVLGACLFNLAIAVALFRRWRPLLIADIQLAAVLGYSMFLAWMSPASWLDPFGSLLKNLPLMAAILVHRVLEQER